MAKISKKVVQFEILSFDGLGHWDTRARILLHWRVINSKPKNLDHILKQSKNGPKEAKIGHHATCTMRKQKLASHGLFGFFLFFALFIVR